MAIHLLGLKARVWVFYLKNLQDERGRLSFNVTQEICSYLGERLLAQVCSSFLRFFDTYTWGPQILLHTSIQVDCSSTWVVLEDGRLFCSGGGNFQLGCCWKVAYLLDRNGTVDNLPDMLSGRCRHGVIQIQHLYIFGGGKL